MTLALHVCADRAEQARRAAATVASALGEALAARPRARLAVSGGTSPALLFDALAALALPWDRVDVTLVDERVVPPDDAASNAALVRARLLRGPAAAARFVPLVDDPGDAPGCAARASAAAEAPTVAVLGMGEDGHTASLFRGAPELDAALDPAQPHDYLLLHPPAAPHARITLSLAALLRAGRLLLLISGDAKRAVLERACRAPTPQLPVSLPIHQFQRPFDVFWAP